MTWEEYKKEAVKFLEVNKIDLFAYLALGLISEKGEVAGVIKKQIRGDYNEEEAKQRLIGELGDCLWYIAVIEEVLGDSYNYPDWSMIRMLQKQYHTALGTNGSPANYEVEMLRIIGLIDVYELDFNEVLEYNIRKLTDRKERNMIKGDGDYR